jgi:hypothetical protein
MMQDAVRASLNYTVDNGVPPDYYFYEPEGPVKLNPPGTDPHEMESSTAGHAWSSSTPIGGGLC